MNETISVIVPVYNVEHYLERCLESITNQTYRNLEILIINDGSTDGSLEICQKYSEIDSRIIIITQENQGCSVARNLGLSMATGDFISFVDSDDYLDPTMLEELYLLLKRYGADISMCSFKYVNTGDIDYERPISSVVDGVLSGHAILTEHMFSCRSTQIYWTVVWNKLYKRCVFDGVEFPADYSMQDLYIMPMIMDKCETIACTSKKLYFYVQQKNSTTLSTNSQLRDAPAVYFHLACFFSRCVEYDKLYMESLLYGMYKYRQLFWQSNREFKADRKFSWRKKEAIRFFRSAWRNGRGFSSTNIRRYVYFELFYINFGLARIICRLLKK